MSNRWAPLIGALVAIAIAAVAGAAFVLIGNTDSRAVLVQDDSTVAGFKALEYRGVRVDIPQDWNRLDTSDCEFEFERWAPSGSEPCDPSATGVAFYGSATFDAAFEPGVRKSDSATKSFEGYVLVGEWAVYVTGPKRGSVTDILATARTVSVNRPAVG